MFVRVVIGAVAVLTSLLLFYSFSTRQQPAHKESIEECCRKGCKNQDNDLMLETFSRQLISVNR